MSSIQQLPVEILLDVFQAVDPAGTEALQLICRRFHATILQNVDALPTRLVCDLSYVASRVYLYPAIYLLSDETSTEHSGKTAIRAVTVRIPSYLPDARLMHLSEHFPSAKGAVRLDMIYGNSVLPTDAALHHFERLETIVMGRSFLYEASSSWSDLLALEAFRRVSNIIAYDYWRKYQAVVDDGALFDFITDFSLMPPDKPRLVKLGPFSDDSLDALKRRFYKDIASIVGNVCAIVLDRSGSEHCLTNMASGSQKKHLAKQLLCNAYGVRP
ncbi:hypothetical protein AAVH_25619 [Aphelenchoides avenae]|nr:hypothetical protein AAVH_25619 [Aphelenchus avenae]